MLAAITIFVLLLEAAIAIGSIVFLLLFAKPAQVKAFAPLARTVFGVTFGLSVFLTIHAPAWIFRTTLAVFVVTIMVFAFKQGFDVVRRARGRQQDPAQATSQGQIHQDYSPDGFFHQ